MFTRFRFPLVLTAIAVTLAGVVGAEREHADPTRLESTAGELAPKSVAIRKPEATSLWVALPLFVFYKATFPAIWVLNHAANGVLAVFGIKPVAEAELAHDEEELRLLLASTGTDQLSAQKRQLLGNVFELSDHTARQIMVPRLSA